MLEFVWLIPLFPAIGFVINGLFGRRLNRKAVGPIACTAIGLSAALSSVLFFALLKQPDRFFEKDIFTWILSGQLSVAVGYQVDALSIVMALVVSWVSFFIHVYSIGYMHEDPGYPRYFTYLNLFVFMMLNLVLANGFLLMFVGWEGVGLCSYLLIGFWFEKDSASNAGKKAFVVNRVGDFGFLLGIFLLVVHFGTLNFSQVFDRAPEILTTSTATTIAVLLFVGAVGKSAQLPLYVWLPDAMEGPTPVSSLIHAATMVTAGVYMVARCHVIYQMAPLAMAIVATIGALTAIYAASIGFAQNDIKKVLAYSTISQLGYMFLGVGVGAYSAGIFHLMTHAFFKGLLFLGAGSVMHAMSGELDMRKMGGLRKLTPITFWTFLIATLAISGFPPFSGFFSKDEILWQAFQQNRLLWAIGFVAAGMTSFYMFRAVFMTFFGECRAPQEVKKHIHESPRIMTVPLMILAALSIAGGWIGIPHALKGANRFHEFLSTAIRTSPETGGSAAAKIHLLLASNQSTAELAKHGLVSAHPPVDPTEYTLMALSVGIALVGLAVAYLLYMAKPVLGERFVASWQRLYRLVLNKYYVDEIYEVLFIDSLKGLGRGLWKGVDTFLIDGAVNGVAYVIRILSDLMRRLQNGLVQSYALSMVVGGVVVMGYYVIRVIFF
ncbi:MAG: NADH-quinone oxidoreductase subunit L [Deltaproteobacteria bacterium]|nr:NADH-quinone oxidoreductase subunit L [Deltaproteobacteria bacterium]